MSFSRVFSLFSIIISKNLTNILYRIGLFIIISFISLFISESAFAQIGILNSNTSSVTFSKAHIGDYNEFWKEIIYTFNHTNVKYDVISEEDITPNTIKNYNILILPLIIDLRQSTIDNIETYTKNGGKIIVIFPDMNISPVAKKLAQFTGVDLEDSQTISYTSCVNWFEKERAAEKDFPVSTKTGVIRLTSHSRSLGIWDNIEENRPAVTLSDKGSYIGWRWGNDGNLSFNSFVIKAVINQLVPNLIEHEQQRLILRNFLIKLKKLRNLEKILRICGFICVIFFTCRYSTTYLSLKTSGRLGKILLSG